MPDISRLATMQPSELQQLYRELFHSPVPAGNTGHARRKIAWHLQARAEGGLPEAVRQHALAIARNQKLQRVMQSSVERRARGDAPANQTTARVYCDHDSRLPLPGSVVVKNYKGQSHIVHVLNSGFEYRGERFSSLSAVATRIAGSRWNGFVFFGLEKGSTNGR
jgi:hypothetical protein